MTQYNELHHTICNTSNMGGNRKYCLNNNYISTENGLIHKKNIDNMFFPKEQQKESFGRTQRKRLTYRFTYRNIISNI